MGINSKVCKTKTKKISDSKATILKQYMLMGCMLLLEDRLDQNKVQMYGMFKRWSKKDDTGEAKMKWWSWYAKKGYKSIKQYSYGKVCIKNINETYFLLMIFKYKPKQKLVDFFAYKTN